NTSAVALSAVGEQHAACDGEGGLEVVVNSAAEFPLIGGERAVGERQTALATDTAAAISCIRVDQTGRNDGRAGTKNSPATSRTGVGVCGEIPRQRVVGARQGAGTIDATAADVRRVPDQGAIGNRQDPGIQNGSTNGSGAVTLLCRIAEEPAVGDLQIPQVQ